MKPDALFRRHAALPPEHGSWGFLLGPLLIGLFAAGRCSAVSLYLVVAVLSAFLVRHPLTLVVKVYSGRRSRETLPAAWFWIAIYATFGALHAAGLAIRGFGYLLYLALPGIPVILWHLRLISKRAERGQWLLEVAASGALALSAPAAMWVGLGWPDPMGWLLWALTWAQSAAAIVYTYLRLAQRVLDRAPGLATRVRMGRSSLLLTTCTLGFVLGLSLGGILPRWLFVPYAVQWVEVLWGIARPAAGFKPQAIGYRQLAVHTLFTVLFILTWRL